MVSPGPVNAAVALPVPIRLWPELVKLLFGLSKTRSTSLAPFPAMMESWTSVSVKLSP